MKFLEILLGFLVIVALIVHVGAGQGNEAAIVLQDTFLKEVSPLFTTIGASEPHSTKASGVASSAGRETSSAHTGQFGGDDEIELRCPYKSDFDSTMRSIELYVSAAGKYVVLSVPQYGYLNKYFDKKSYTDQSTSASEGLVAFADFSDENYIYFGTRGRNGSSRKSIDRRTLEYSSGVSTFECSILPHPKI